ncbi:chorismate mutase [Deinococcus proteolyticus MRP]|uniref:Chorismate mutase n=1 Tax=Deinococcus proteolyticus (strain ATCC 35074 / DSM 20540 / JCM 6276 / NBRC 101906 / NCIMB 13154 / VKM Ac-1939 / CCM 2703 / MRP) TaxID=693977 RepID=F0RJI4_DEIPM|nr:MULTISPECIES: bifunctional chorismate mutase/prephenate dehydrogenase [Deinococcus]ADY25525.1 chorismate mutase [Deinococcus proteolyticus MRP]MCY1701645.1 bifunctional chorismate mutase/prephenate dehydrogenase [Deinococcus sp. SL84]
MTPPELAALREQIDANDRELLQLLRQRVELARQVGDVKRAQGLPIYVPEREAALLDARRAEAQALGLSPDLAEDVLRRCMRESYVQETGHSVGVRPGLRVVVVGGGGRLGRRFVQAFRESGYEVAVLERGDWDRAAELVQGAGLVLVSVPIHDTAAVMAQLPPLPPGCLLADLTSVKAAPMQAMLAAHSGPVLGLHPMFGPDVLTFAKEVTVFCRGRGEPGEVDWLLEQLRLWGLRLHAAQPEEHDRHMGLIQAMRHATAYAYGLNLSRERPQLDELLALSSPIYRLELMMVGRLFAQDPELYYDIIQSQRQHLELIRDYHATLADVIGLLERDDRDAFTQRFCEVREFFGPLGEQFLNESRVMLAQSKDRAG